MEAVNVINQSERLKNKRRSCASGDLTVGRPDPAPPAGQCQTLLPAWGHTEGPDQGARRGESPPCQFIYVKCRCVPTAPPRPEATKAVTASLFLRVLIYGFKLALLLSCQLQLLVSHLFLVFISFLSSFYCASSPCPAPTRLWCQKMAVFTVSFCSPPASNRNIWPFSYKPSACL